METIGAILRKRQKREENKRRGICTRCKEQKALKGFSYCMNCHEKVSLYYREWRKEKKKRKIGEFESGLIRNSVL